uniref:Putative secreted protein n=1 Tax=Anopheles marajoara TaxID=58244 RepID=A0A2M4C5N1_9DIPT
MPLVFCCCCCCCCSSVGDALRLTLGVVGASGNKTRDTMAPLPLTVVAKLPDCPAMSPVVGAAPPTHAALLAAELCVRFSLLSSLASCCATASNSASVCLASAVHPFISREFSCFSFFSCCCCCCCCWSSAAIGPIVVVTSTVSEPCSGVTASGRVDIVDVSTVRFNCRLIGAILSTIHGCVRHSSTVMRSLGLIRSARLIKSIASLETPSNISSGKVSEHLVMFRKVSCFVSPPNGV